jgi:hypothetical protein
MSLRVRIRDFRHPLDGLAQNARRGSSPPGVDRGKSTRVGIRKKHREAVRNLHADGNPALPGNQRIRFLRSTQVT